MRRALEIGLDVLGLAGVGLFVYGMWLLSPPFAYMIGGAGAVTAAVALSGRLD